jgi:hypothetical protein
MSCDTVPAFFQRQPVLPLPVQDWFRERTDAAVTSPEERQRLVWPLVLGAPRLRESHPDGIPERLLLEVSAGPLAALGIPDPEEAWERVRVAHPDEAERGSAGWKPHQAWGRFAPLLSLRAGVALTVLTGLPEDECYPFAAGAGLFNACLYHECHDALEPLWSVAEGALKRRLQGLILLTGGYHHLQLLNRGGMRALWEESLRAMEGVEDRLETPWGALGITQSLQTTVARLAWLEEDGGSGDLAPLWDLPRPAWELK